MQTMTKRMEATVADARVWLQAFQTLSCAVPTFTEQREEAKRFCYLMGQNNARVQKAINDEYEVVNRECQKIVAVGGGEAAREMYQRGQQLLMKAFAEKGPDGQPVMETNGQGGVRMRIPGKKKALLETRLRDYDAGHKEIVAALKKATELIEGFDQRQVKVDLFCADYKDIPDTVNGCYMVFIEKILMGMPRPCLTHRILVNSSARDPKFRADLVSRLAECIDAGVKRAATHADIALSIFNVLYVKPKE